MSVVVGYVPTKQGDAALRYAVDEAKRRDCGLTVVFSDKGGSHAEDLIVDDILGKARKALQEAGVPHEVKGFVRGNTVDEDIGSVAERTGADCIVIGLRRRSPVGKLLLGSHAQHILLSANCPVIAVKADDED